MIDVARFVLAGCLGLLGLYVVGLHYWFVARSLMGRKVPSMLPLIGGVSLAIAAVILPVDGSSWWWWLPLLLDPGSTWMVFGGAYMAVREYFGSESPPSD